MTFYFIPSVNPPCRDPDLFFGYIVKVLNFRHPDGGVFTQLRGHVSIIYTHPPNMIQPHKRAKLADFGARGLVHW